ncbi:MAG: hypothetical protein MUC88_18330, partial [Planctomycetes bacterium]|nr:hypothetical protein [Planctomycetota bacterium]
MPTPELPDLVLVSQDVSDWRGQVVYLDFDGEESVLYEGPVTVGPFDVPAFEGSRDLAGRTQDGVMAGATEDGAESLADVIAHEVAHLLGYAHAGAGRRGALAGVAENVSGTIATNTTWANTGEPYRVTGDLTINAGVTLTIRPGV